MSHTPDFEELGSGFVAVGWLHPDHPFPTADPVPEFLAKLNEYAGRARASAAAFQSGAAGGFHTCEFCGRAHSSVNIRVPAGEKVYLSPAMIAHYVEVHRYAPPAEYVGAVMASPLPGTRAYVDAVAPVVRRARLPHMREPLSLTLERHVALTLLDYLTRLSDTDKFAAEDRADQVAVWTLESELRSLLPEPFDPTYEELLARARRRVVNYGKDDPEPA